MKKLVLVLVCVFTIGGALLSTGALADIILPPPPPPPITGPGG